MLKIQNLTITKQDHAHEKPKLILDNISLELPSGEIFAYIWPNGAGKSTTIKSILQLKKIHSWSIYRFDKKNFQSIKHLIGYAPDEAIFYEHLNAIEHIDFFAKLTKITTHDAKKLLHEVGLHSSDHHIRVKNYSKGMKQRLGLAISLLHNPKLLIRDEPMSGLDPIGRSQIKSLIKTLKSQGKTIFFSTHILSDVEEIADRFAIIDKGKILHTGHTSHIAGSLENFFLNTIQKTH